MGVDATSLLVIAAAAGVAGLISTAVAPRLVLEPLVGFRQWSPADYRGGRLYSAGLGARYGISDQLTAHVTGRLDTGWIYAARGRADLTGTGLTLWVRYQQ